MNRFIFILSLMGGLSSFGMDAPTGPIPYAQQKLLRGIAESANTPVQQGSILELVPETVQKTLETYIFTGRGVGVAQLYAIAADMRSLRLVSRANKAWIDSNDAQLNHTIEVLARQYTNNNRVQVAVALGTKRAFEWLCKKKRSYFDDLTKEVISQLMLGQTGVACALIAASKNEKIGPKPGVPNLNYDLVGVDGNTVLNAAAKVKDQKVFDEVLPKSIDQIDTPNSQKITPLLHAIDNGHTDRALKLLELGASAIHGPRRDSALQHALEKNNTPVIKELFRLNKQEVSAGINFTSENNPTLPLTIAARNNNYDAFKLILGVPGVRIKTEVIYWAIAQNENMLADLLQRTDIDFNQTCSDLGYPLFGLVAQTQKGQPLLDDKAARDRLGVIAARVGLNVQMEENGKTVLMIAVEQGKAKTIEKLLELGANIHLRDSEGKTALDYAQNLTTHNKDRIVKMLQAAQKKTEEIKSV